MAAGGPSHSEGPCNQSPGRARATQYAEELYDGSPHPEVTRNVDGPNPAVVEELYNYGPNPRVVKDLYGNEPKPVVVKELWTAAQSPR